MNKTLDHINLPIELKSKEILDKFELGLYRMAFLVDFKSLDVSSYLDCFKKSKKITTRVYLDNVLLEDFKFIKDSLNLTKRDTWVLILSYINKNPKLFLNQKENIR